MKTQTQLQARTGGGPAPPAAPAHRHAVEDSRAEGRLILALGLTALIVVVEGIGGLLANSLALLADAGHVFADLFALGMTLFALRQARRPADAFRTFGYHRVGILTALLNAATLIPLSGFLVYEAVRRLAAPGPVEGGVMLGVAAVGLAANLAIGLGLHGVAHGNLNLQSAVVHVVGDAAAAAGVLIGAGVILLTGWTAVDPLLSIAISLLIAFSGWRLLRDTVRILLESVPAGISTAEVVRAMMGLPGVQDVHDLHIWQIGPGIYALSCHVLIADQPVSQGATILHDLQHLLADRFGITHSTIQPECAGCDLQSLYCVLQEAAPGGAAHDHVHVH